MDELSTIQKQVITKLYLYGYIGKIHTALDNIPKGFPKHLRGEVKKETEKLIRKNWIQTHPTSYGYQVSLNPERICEAKRIAETS